MKKILLFIFALFLILFGCSSKAQIGTFTYKVPSNVVLVKKDNSNVGTVNGEPISWLKEAHILTIEDSKISLVFELIDIDKTDLNNLDDFINNTKASLIEIGYVNTTKLSKKDDYEVWLFQESNINKTNEEFEKEVCLIYGFYHKNNSYYRVNIHQTNSEYEQNKSWILDFLDSIEVKQLYVEAYFTAFNISNLIVNNNL